MTKIYTFHFKLSTTFMENNLALTRGSDDSEENKNKLWAFIQTLDLSDPSSFGLSSI